MKKIISIITASAMALSLTPIMASAAQSGKDSSITWTFDDSGTLTVSGSGEVNTQFTFVDDDFYESIKNVVIEEGITSIGETVFDYCTNLSTVTLPDGITEIGTAAFASCRSLRNINIPDTVSKLGGGAFSECCKLTNITIPKTVTEIGDGAFASCYALKSVKIPDSIKTIGENTFRDCKLLGSITIPSSVKLIEDHAFENCPTLKNIHYIGTETEWADIEIREWNDDLKKARIFFEPGTESDIDASAAEGSTEVSVKVNGNAVVFDQKPVIQNSRTLVPLRAIFEALGAKVGWDSDTRTVTASRNGMNISLTIGSSELHKNSETIWLDVPAQIMNDRTMVPVRAISEAFGAYVEWIDGEVIITLREAADTSGNDINTDELTLEDFSFVKLDMDMQYIFDKIGEPHYYTGSGLRWGVYNLADGSKLRLNDRDTGYLQVMKLDTPDGNSEEIDFDKNGSPEFDVYID